MTKAPKFTAPVTYDPNWLTRFDADGMFDALIADLAWVHRDAPGEDAPGVPKKVPRREYWANTYNRPYTYGSGIGERTYDAQPTHWAIDLVRQKILASCGVLLEGCFLNRYEGGSDSLGYHSDDDPAIDHSKPIAVVTLGTPREIRFKSMIPGSHAESIELQNGSLMLMGAGMQHTHKHSIPKKVGLIGTRISMTYRGLMP